MSSFSQRDEIIRAINKDNFEHFYNLIFNNQFKPLDFDLETHMMGMCRVKFIDAMNERKMLSEEIKQLLLHSSDPIWEQTKNNILKEDIKNL